jgi:hypothetical protein
MPSNKRIFLTLLGTLVLSILLALSGEGQNSLTVAAQEGDRNQVKKQQKWRPPVPINAAPDPADPEKRVLRQAKNRRYNSTRSDQLLSEQPAGFTYGRISEAPRPSALPISQSDVAILGTVINAQPYLSEKKTSTYTEFTIRVEEVFKNDARAPLGRGDSIIADREGGSLRLPDGRELRYEVYQIARPLSVGGRYVLFLERINQGQDLSILTGYELRAGRVFSLEDWGDSLRYNDSDETTFKAAFTNRENYRGAGGNSSGIALNFTATQGSGDYRFNLLQEGDKVQKRQRALLPDPIDIIPEPIDPEKRTLRRAKNRRYNYDRGELLTNQPPGFIYGRFSEAGIPPPLPASLSHLVILGTVTSAQPYLAESKTSIYTEYTVSIEEVFKNETRDSFAPGDSVTVEREGGALRLQDGRVLRYRVGGIGLLPSSGEQYVFFLKSIHQGQDLSILRAYELREDQVYSLESNDPSSPVSSNKTIFLNAVKEAVESSRRITSPAGKQRY